MSKLSMPHVSSEGELLALAALVAPSFVDVSNEQYQEYVDQQQGIFLVDVDANAVVPTAIDEAMQFRQNVLRKHAREGSTLQNAIESYLPKGGDGKWFVDAVRTAVSIIRTNVVNIGVEAKKKNVKNPEWLLPADQNPFVLRAGDERVEDIFPNGDFLLHTTSVEAAEAIINCGTLYSSRDGLEKGVVNPETRNNGTLAVSWSLNDVWAMPGTLYHINGFLASPHEVVTNKRQKLFVPTDAAYAEVQHMPVTSDEKKYKQLYEQFILFRSAIAEYQKIGASVTMPGAYKNTNCYKTLQYYKKQFAKPDYKAPFVFKGPRTEIDNGLLESSRSSLAVLLMAAAEGGDLQEYTGIENVSDLFNADEALLYNATGMLPTFFDDELEAIMLEIETTYDGVKHSTTNRGFDITSMVFVCSRDDFETSWKYVFATAQTTPKAVVLYEDEQVRVPNFVHEKGLGDHEKLKEAIRKVIPARTTTFDWKRLLPDHSGPIMHKEALRGIVATHLTRNAVSIQRVEQNELRTH